MKIFIDSANLDEIRELDDMGVISGVTTNPSLIAKEGKDFIETIKMISSIVEGPISAEVMSDDAEGMIKEGMDISKVHKNIVVKIPMTAEGLKAVKYLSREGVKTNVTLIFTPAQALLAANAGATFVSPFIGRSEDIFIEGIEVVGEIAKIYNIHNLSTRIIAASIRTPKHVVEAAKAGAHIATAPYKVIMQMLNHPLTDQGIAKFKSDWNKAFKSKKTEK